MRNILINLFLISGYVLAGLQITLGKTENVMATQIKQEILVVLALGDSLTAGFGVQEEESFPSRLQVKIDQSNLGYKVINAGVSGDTTAGGVRRIDWLMKHKPKIVILAL